jgi:putative peptidoglycan lipid II flippase
MSANQRDLSRFAAIFAGGTLLSRILGLVRDIAIAAIIPGPSKDAFFAAFRFPNMLRDLIGEGATNAAVVPVLSEYRANKSEQAFQDLIRSALSVMVVVLLVLTVGGMLALQYLPQLLEALSPFVDRAPLADEKVALFTTMAVWTFPYLFFICLAAFAMGPLFTVKHYATPSWSPALLNVALLIMLLFASYFAESAWALVIGVWIGGAAQLFVMFRAMKRRCGVATPNFRFGHPGVWQMALLLIPVIFGQAAGEVNKLVDNLFAMKLQTGTVTGLFYANRLVQLPLSIFGLASAAAILPTLSAAYARKAHGEMHDTMLVGLRQSFYLVAPSMIGLIILREPLARLFFEHGEMTPQDTYIIASALGLYAAGLLFFAWVKVLVTGFFARQDTITPVVIASVSMGLNILLNFVLVGPMEHRGLALATTISYGVNAALLYIFLSTRMGWLINRQFATVFLRMGVALAMMAAATYAVFVRLSAYDNGETAGAALTALVPIGAAVVVYFTLSYWFQIPDFLNYAAALRRRVKQ